MRNAGVMKSSFSAAPSDVLRGAWREAGVFFLAPALVALGAQVRVPVPGTDVPMTLQLPAVVLIGFSLTASRAAASMVSYITLGAAGVPVFAPGSLGLIGPTGGYLVGFVLAAWLVALLRGQGEPGAVRLAVAGTAGAAMVLGLGVLWRLVWVTGDVGTAVMTGFVPFWWKALIEVALIVTVTVGARSAHRWWIGD